MSSLSRFLSQMHLSQELTITCDGAISPSTSFTVARAANGKKLSRGRTSSQQLCRWTIISSCSNASIPATRPDRRWNLSESSSDISPVKPMRKRTVTWGTLKSPETTLLSKKSMCSLDDSIHRMTRESHTIVVSNNISRRRKRSE